MKKILYTAISIISIIMVFCLAGCSSSDKKYLTKVDAYGIWSNKADQSIAQYKLYNIMDEFLSKGDYKTVSGVPHYYDKVTGKMKRIAFIGWDGVRADALANIFNVKKDGDKPSINDTPKLSGLNELKSAGGLYLAYAGGEKGKDSEQDTSTSPGWMSQFTGVWGKDNGVIDNNGQKAADVADTVFMKYGKKGLKTSLCFEWGPMFDINLYNEVRAITDNKDLKMKYTDVDRESVVDIADMMTKLEIKKQKDLPTTDIKAYNEVAARADTLGENAKYDSAIREQMLWRIESNDDIVAGIFSSPDNNGHNFGFNNNTADYVNAIRNSDLYTYEIIQAIDARMKDAAKNEDWLIIASTDHGGSKKGHGKQILEHRTTWFATNKRVLSTYYGNGYNGFTELY